MALKDIFTIIKADRYTADGREELNKAIGNVTEDVKYNIGDISQKTGLQKTANGWVTPNETKYGKVTQNNGQWGVQQKLGKGSQFISHKNEKDAKRALANYTSGYNTTARSKQDPHSDEARQIKQWDKETKQISKENRANKRAEHASHFQESKPAENKTDFAKKYPGIKQVKMAPNTPIDLSNKHYDRSIDADSLKEADKQVTEWLKEGDGMMPHIYLVDENGKAEAFTKKAGLVNRLARKIEAGKTYDLITIKPQDAKEMSKGIGDSASRVLTGDTKIRVRKSK